MIFSSVQTDLHVLNSDLLIFDEVLLSPKPNIYDVGIHSCGNPAVGTAGAQLMHAPGPGSSAAPWGWLLLTLKITDHNFYAVLEEPA